MEQIILYEKLERNKNLVDQMYQKMKILETENNLKDEKIKTQEKSEIKKELNLVKKCNLENSKNSFYLLKI